MESALNTTTRFQPCSNATNNNKTETWFNHSNDRLNYKLDNQTNLHDIYEKIHDAITKETTEEFIKNHKISVVTGGIEKGKDRCVIVHFRFTVLT